MTQPGSWLTKVLWTPPTALCTRILHVRCDATHRTGLRKDLMLVFGDPCFCGLFGLARVEPFCYPILQQGKDTSLPTSARVDRAVASGVTETCIVGLSTLQGLMFRVRVSRFRVQGAPFMCFKALHFRRRGPRCMSYSQWFPPC